MRQSRIADDGQVARLTIATARLEEWWLDRRRRRVDPCAICDGDPSAASTSPAEANLQREQQPRHRRDECDQLSYLALAHGTRLPAGARVDLGPESRTLRRPRLGVHEANALSSQTALASATAATLGRRRGTSAPGT